MWTCGDMKRKHNRMEEFSEICTGDRILFYSNENVKMVKNLTGDMVVSKII